MTGAINLRDTCLLIRTDKQLQWSRESFFFHSPKPWRIQFFERVFAHINKRLLCRSITHCCSSKKMIHNSFTLFKSQIPLVSSLVLTVKCNPIKLKHTFRRNHTTLSQTNKKSESVMQKSYTHVVIKFVARLRLPLFAKNREDPCGCWQPVLLYWSKHKLLPPGDRRQHWSVASAFPRQSALRTEY